MNFTSPYVDLPKRLTVAQNLAVFADLYGLRRPRERIAAVAEDCDLVELLARPYGSLSAGQRTRVSLAKAVLNEPDVLLLDEPTASLDPDIGDRMRTYLERYQHRTGCTMLLASHHMGEVERMCDDVIMLRAGVVVDQGSPPQLIARYGRGNMEEVFLDIARGRRRRARRPQRARGKRGVTGATDVAMSHRCRGVGAARARGAAPPRLPDPPVVDAHRVDDVLPVGDDDRLGIPDAVSRADQQFPEGRAGHSSSAPCCCGTSCFAASSACR